MKIPISFHIRVLEIRLIATKVISMKYNGMIVTILQKVSSYYKVSKYVFFQGWGALTWRKESAHLLKVGTVTIKSF